MGRKHFFVLWVEGVLLTMCPRGGGWGGNLSWGSRCIWSIVGQVNSSTYVSWGSGGSDPMCVLGVEGSEKKCAAPGMISGTALMFTVTYLWLVFIIDETNWRIFWASSICTVCRPTLKKYSAELHSLHIYIYIYIYFYWRDTIIVCFHRQFTGTKIYHCTACRYKINKLNTGDNKY